MTAQVPHRPLKNHQTFHAPQAKARYVRAMFDRIARRYDLLNRLMSLGRDRSWRRFAAKSADLPPGGLALDVATGTADQALALARQTTTARVIGVDFSPEMMALGRRKVTAAGMAERIQFVAADALALPFAHCSFACATSSFAMRNVADIPQTIAEMRRVTRRGGRVVILETSQPTIPGFRQLYSLYFHHIVPLLGGWISGQPDAYAYLPESVYRFLSPDQLKAIMERVGLARVEHTSLSLGTVAIHVGVRQHIRPQLSSSPGATIHLDPSELYSDGTSLRQAQGMLVVCHCSPTKARPWSATPGHQV